MTINYTSLLGLAQPVTGTEANTWGTVVNDEITALLEEAVAGGETIDVTGGNVTLTDTDGVANQARNAILLVTGTPGTSRNIIAPSQSKVYLIKNGSDGAVVLKGAATTGVTIPVGVEAVCFWNGSDFEIAGVTGPASSTDNAVARFDSTTGKVIQNSGVTIDDSNNVSGVAQLNITTLDATNIEVTNIKAKDGTAAGSIADSTGIVTLTSVTGTTADYTNIEVTNIKAKDGTAAGSIADSTGVVTLASTVLTTTDINGGTIDGTTIGGASAAAGTFTTVNKLTITAPATTATLTIANNKTLTANSSITLAGTDATTMTFPSTSATIARTDAAQTFTGVQTFSSPIIVNEIIYPVASFSWNSALASPAAAFDADAGRLINAHRNMRRCLLQDNGTVNYYLDPTDSTKKADGTSSVLTGADGMVMVEIPKFYVRRQVAGTITTWSVSDTVLPGFVVHPAFNKNGVEVSHRYYSAYDACAFDVSGSVYISGLNRDNAVSNTPNVDATATTGDKLASVSGIYPMVGLTRAQFRTIAANRGSGWRQLDWTLFSAVQVLYLTEYQTFFSQSRLGDGNVNGSYVTQSGDQNDSPNSIAGLTNSIGNASTNGSQASAGAKPGTAFMSYRGIENFYGNCNNWADGCIVNPDGSVSANQARMWWTNNSADFSDSVKTNMTEIAVNLTTGGDFASAIAATDYFFVATSVSGGSASTFITDGYFGSTSDDRVVRVSGFASSGADAGAFYVSAVNDSSFANRGIGARLAF